MTCCEVLWQNVAIIAEEQFAKLDAQYSNAEGSLSLRSGTVEDRMLLFQRQVEERSRVELNAAVCVIDVCRSFLLCYCFWCSWKASNLYNFQNFFSWHAWSETKSVGRTIVFMNIFIHHEW